MLSDLSKETLGEVWPAKFWSKGTESNVCAAGHTGSYDFIDTTKSRCLCSTTPRHLQLFLLENARDLDNSCACGCRGSGLPSSPGPMRETMCTIKFKDQSAATYLHHQKWKQGRRAGSCIR